MNRDLAELLRAADPAADLAVLPEQQVDDQLAAILASDPTEARFEALPRSPRRRWALLALAALVSFGLIIAVTLNTRLGSYPFLAPPDRAAWARDILLTAAANQVDLVAEPGQYWRHEVDGRSVVPREVQEPTGEFSGAVVANHQINFHPVSKDDPECVWIIAMNEPVAQLGAGFPIEGIDPITVCPPPNPEIPAPRDLSGVPRDPVGFQAYMDDQYVGMGQPRNVADLYHVTSIVAEGKPPAPAELRSTAYQYLAQVSGITVTDPHVKIGDRHGVAIGLAEPPERLAQHLVLDAETGELLGIGLSITPGEVEYCLAISITVIDKLPDEVVRAACEHAAADPEWGVCPEG